MSGGTSFGNVRIKDEPNFESDENPKQIPDGVSKIEIKIEPWSNDDEMEPVKPEGTKTELNMYEHYKRDEKVVGSGVLRLPHLPAAVAAVMKKDTTRDCPQSSSQFCCERCKQCFATISALALHEATHYESHSDDVSTNYPVEFISTRRGGIAILYDGHKYHRKKFYSNSNSFWLCYNFKTGCKGSITLNSKNQIVKNKLHNIDCIQNYAQNKILKELDTLKYTTGSNLDSIQKQYDAMVYKLENDGIHLLTEIPSFQNKKSGLFNHRNKVLGVPKLRFQSACEVVVPKKFLKNFLLADYVSHEDGKRILMFCRENLRHSVKSFRHILGDGTYKTCPKVFKQIYSIHGCNEQDKTAVPLIYCLLPDKNQKTYEIMFRLTETIFRDWMPATITMDYEMAAIKAVQHVYPRIQVKGCFFHYNRCLFRKSNNLKMATPVKKRHASRCAGISRLPPEFTDIGLEYVMRRSPAGEDVGIFNQYFRTQWQETINFDKTCGCDKEQIGKIYNLEAWHERIHRLIGQKSNTVVHLLEVLIKEMEISDIFKTNVKKSERYVEIDKEIDCALNDLKNGRITVGHCVEIISPYAFIF